MKKLRHLRYALLLGLPVFIMGCIPFSITIFSPLDGENFEVGEGITFTGSARDVLEGKLIGDSLVWTSDIDGQIGTGNEFIRDDLSEGIHEITLTAINSQGGERKSTVHISIGETILITDSAQLISPLNSLIYKDFGYYTTGHLPISEDVQIIGTITISSEQLIVPEDGDRFSCRDKVGFRNVYGADGIMITPLSPDHKDLYPPSSLTLTNIKLRFRPLYIDIHPWNIAMALDYWCEPVIQLMPPSDHECKSYEIRCEEDQMCYIYGSYCRYCIALSQEECVCRNENGILPDGTYCEIFVSNDDIMDGKCQDGECVIEGWD